MDTAFAVTLLTGFLGAGKTTLLNRLLAAPHGEKIAIVENEFGATGIDAELLAPGAVSVTELANGCICCSVRGELAAALAELLAQRDSGALAFDRLIIETTGLADPGPVIQTFFWEEALASRFRLDGVITLIDACHAAEQLDRERVAAAQVAYADRLVITKTDLAGAQELATLSERLARINARAPIIVAGSADERWQDLFALGGFELDERGLPAFRPARARNALGGRSWDDAIESRVFEMDRDLDLDAVSDFVDALIERHSADLLRYKGILAIAGDERRLIFQGVHKIAGFDYGRPWEGQPRKSRLVLIGRALPFDAIATDLTACASPA
ncbi:CobW family GTP-binding protein [Niveibacterium terrae]|uniref:CobW family GTP-binding protein n=1 Tax=Niveibacterium terrae TaxID=3373598 RepID=UPI003A920F00